MGRSRLVSERIVDSILADLRNRRGLRQEWEQIDNEIQAEIIDTWQGICDGEIRAALIRGLIVE